MTRVIADATWTSTASFCCIASTEAFDCFSFSISSAMHCCLPSRLRTPCKAADEEGGSTARGGETFPVVGEVDIQIDSGDVMWIRGDTDPGRCCSRVCHT